MAEIPKTASGNQDELQQSEAGAPNCFVAIDIDNLSLAAAANNKDSAPSPRLPKTLSRKGSQRGRTERKTTAKAGTTSTGGARACDGPLIAVHFLGKQETYDLPRVPTPTAVGGETGGKCRMVDKRSPLWLSPRRVLMFFAALSSMGTLLLLYFTLTMGKMTGGDTDDRWFH